MALDSWLPTRFNWALIPRSVTKRNERPSYDTLVYGRGPAWLALHDREIVEGLLGRLDALRVLRARITGDDEEIPSFMSHFDYTAEEVSEDSMGLDSDPSVPVIRGRLSEDSHRRY